MMETKAKKLKCLLSYYGIKGFSLGQISELLRLTKESCCNVKLKCSDTGQHTVDLFYLSCLLNLMLQSMDSSLNATNYIGHFKR